MKVDMCKLIRLHLEECYDCRQFVIDKVTAINAAKAGSTISSKKSEAARENGKLGGRPKK